MQSRISKVSYHVNMACIQGLSLNNHDPSHALDLGTSKQPLDFVPNADERSRALLQIQLEIYVDRETLCGQSQSRTHLACAA
jgi:hypothetical protein